MVLSVGHRAVKTLHSVRTVELHLVGHMAVNIQSKRRCCVPEIALNGLNVVAGSDRRHRISVAKVVEADVLCSDLRYDLLEIPIQQAF